MHLFLHDRRPRWRSVLFASAAVFGVVAAALAWLRVDFAEMADFVARWNPSASGDSTVRGSETVPGNAGSATPSAEVRSQLALAQTYAELGQRAEALHLLERLALANPEDGEIAFTRASLLGRGSDPGELETAFELYEAAAKQSPRLGALARLHQGVIRARLGDGAGALQIWREQLALQPEEPFRSLFEDAIARAGVVVSDS
jgi:tetratricopeptide (TPR) repeat protein